MKKILGFLLVLLLLTGCSAKAIMTVDGFEVSQDLYHYYYQSAADQYEGDTAASEARELLRAHVAVIRFAEQYGISLSSAEEKEIDRQIQSSKNRNDDFAEQLSKQNLTESLYRELCLHDALREKLMAHLHASVYTVTEEQMREILQAEFVCVRHIFFENTVDGAEQAAQTVAAQLSTGADFDALFTEYMGQDYSDEPYLFGKGYMVEEFEQAARALSVGQVSGVVQTAYGWHIIYRLPLDWDTIEKNLDTITEEYIQTQISMDMAQAASQYEIVE